MLTKIKYRFFVKDVQGKECPWESGTLLGFSTITRKTLNASYQYINNQVIVGNAPIPLSGEEEVIMAMVAKDDDGFIVSIPHYYCKLNDEEG